MAKKRNPTKCANCQAEVWLGAFFAGPFLCEDCQQNAASIILRLKKRLTKRAADRRKAAAQKRSVNKNLVGGRAVR